METVVDFPKPLPAEMGINLCGRYLAVSEHHLDGAQVSPSFEKMGSKGVAEDMRAYLILQARGDRVLMQ